VRKMLGIAAQVLELLSDSAGLIAAVVSLKVLRDSRKQDKDDK